MPIDPAGWPFVAGALVVWAVVAALTSPAWASPFLLLAVLFLLFFRDPDRAVTPGPDVVLSPADGRVLVAGAAEASAAPAGAWQQISIFLSPLDVHVNRIPAAGVVTRVSYRPGRFLPA